MDESPPSPGTLYLVATPIGNLEDMSARALRILTEVPLIAAEDTRHTGRLLAHFGIRTPMISYHAYNERTRRDRLLAALATGDLALVSDAGSPGISDPGHDLVVAAAEAGFRISPIPGASALTAALLPSGLVDGPFVAVGFLPRGGGERKTLLARVGLTGLPAVLFEAPGRVVATLSDLEETWGNRPAAVLRELTKRHEEILRGSLSDLRSQMTGVHLRGEIVIVVGAGSAEPHAGGDEALQILEGLRRGGLSPSQAAREAAAMTGLARSELYDLARRTRSPKAQPTDHDL